MTNQEINLRVAEIKGITVLAVNGEVFIAELFKVGRCYTGCSELLDYINNWNLLGPLEDELLDAAGWYLQKNNKEFLWTKVHRDIISVRHKCRGKATCLAYIEEFGK